MISIPHIASDICLSIGHTLDELCILVTPTGILNIPLPAHCRRVSLERDSVKKFHTLCFMGISAAENYESKHLRYVKAEGVSLER